METILKAPSAQRERPSPLALPWEWLLELEPQSSTARQAPTRVAVLVNNLVGDKGWTCTWSWPPPGRGPPATRPRARASNACVCRTIARLLTPRT